jgi:hypothetical protein
VAAAIQADADDSGGGDNANRSGRWGLSSGTRALHPSPFASPCRLPASSLVGSRSGVRRWGCCGGALGAVAQAFSGGLRRERKQRVHTRTTERRHEQLLKQINRVALLQLR